MTIFRINLLVLLFWRLQKSLVSGFFIVPDRTRALWQPVKVEAVETDNNVDDAYSPIIGAQVSRSSQELTRRQLGQRLLLGGMATTSAYFSVPVSRAKDPGIVGATAATQEKEAQGLVSTDRIAALLHSVPTFTIVDKKGVPFMVVGEDAKVTGYFFTEYGEADRILQLARTSADKSIAESKKDPKQTNSEDLFNPWKQARISTVPLDLAVSIVTKSMFSGASSSFKNLGGGNYYFQVAPSEQDIEDALAITGKDDLAEGKVPLFYYEDFVVEKNGVKETPLFFRLSELKEAYHNEKHPGESPDKTSYPPVLVSELFAVLAEMVKPGGRDEDLKTLVFVPPRESLQNAKECERKGGKEAAFLLGPRNLVL